jgi:DNA repair exonuclease SbcCD ATPase subunit
MRLEQLHIDGYRHLRGRFEFGDELTLVSGPNEAGKTTLHEALVRGLFGFSPEDRRRRDGTSLKDERAPWDGGQFGLSLRLRVAEHGALLAAWDFSGDEVRLIDADTGDQILHEQPRQRVDYAVGSRLLGMTREEFRQVCCLFQEAVGTVEPNQELRTALQQAVESTAAKDVGVEAADERLRMLLSEIGVHAGHYGLTAGGALRRLTDRENALERALQDAQQQRGELEQITVELRVAEQQRDALERKAVAIEQALRCRRVRDLEQRMARVERLTLDVEARPENAMEIPPDVRGRIAALREQLDVLATREPRVEGDVAAQAPVVRELEDRVRDMTERVAEFEPYANVDRSDEDEVRRLLAVSRAVGTEFDEGDPAPPPERDPDLARYRERRDEFLTRQSTQTGRGWRPGLLIAAVALALTGVIGAAAVHPALGVLLLGAVAGAVAARPRTGGARSDALEAFGGRKLQELDRAVADEDRRVIAYESAMEERARARATREEERGAVLKELGRLLDRHAGFAGETQTRANTYLAHCTKARELVQLVAEREGLLGRLRDAREPGRLLAETRNQRESLVEELRRAYRRTGIEEQDLDTAADMLAELLKSAGAAEDRARRADEADAERGALLDGSSPDALARDLDLARQALREHQAAHGRQDADPRDADGLRSASNDVRAQLSEKRVEVAGLSARLLEREEGMADPAELELEIADVRRRRAEAEITCDAVRIARDALSDAAHETHRRVAPYLNEALRRALPHITRGRYSDGTIDEDLGIKLYTPGTRRLVSVEQLSRGTRDQVALVQRLEIARLLDPTAGSAPLLLDDPFAHFDSVRLRLGVELLAEVAETRQVVLFTEDTEVVDAVVDACPGCHRIELADPVEQPIPVSGG